MNAFLNKRGMKTDYGDSRYSQYGFVIKLVEQIAKINGAIFFGFALLVFMMFIQLTIINAKQEMHLLTILGTSPDQLQKFLLRKIMPIYLYTIGSILILLSLLQYFLSADSSLQKSEIVLSPVLPLQVFLVAGFLLLILWGINYYTIRKHIRKNI
jgi:hypothetical protein